MGATRQGAPVDSWAERYLGADDLERRLVQAAVDCVARWGLTKTSLEDIAREAGVSRATVYRIFPGGKERLVETVVHHKVGQLFHEWDSVARATTSLEDLLCMGVQIGMDTLCGNAALSYLLRHEPQAVLPVFAFDRLKPVLEAIADLAAPHLGRFLPADRVRPATEFVTRLVLSYSFTPSDELDPSDSDSIRRFVRTYVLPALAPSTSREQP